jgi:glycosyltransferase involved in cell wall biosynthesis
VTSLSKKPFIVACIPAYNEERTIAKVIVKTMKHVAKVIVCNDGSTDMTAEIAEKLNVKG